MTTVAETVRPGRLRSMEMLQVVMAGAALVIVLLVVLALLQRRRRTGRIIATRGRRSRP